MPGRATLSVVVVMLSALDVSDVWTTPSNPNQQRHGHGLRLLTVATVAYCQVNTISGHYM